LISHAHLLLSLIVVVSIVLMLIRPRNIPEVYWIGAGVLYLFSTWCHRNWRAELSPKR
jgi:sterol desaturase/sphingolipid hydroxylase (fatty acid hydroxylase superfamily)